MFMFVTISPQIRIAQLLGDHMSRQVYTDMGVIGSLQVRPDISTGEQWLRRYSAGAQSECTSTWSSAHVVLRIFI